MSEISERALCSGHAVIAAAEECRRQAEVMVGEPPYGGLAGQPSCWCVVTKNRKSRLVYHTPADEQNLRAHIAIGHKVGAWQSPSCVKIAGTRLSSWMWTAQAQS